jgi:hypothetical protein
MSAKAAKNLAQRWRDNNPHYAKDEIPVVLPQDWAFLGNLTRIDYDSDKFDDELQSYYHDSDTEPMMLGAEQDGYTMILIIGKKSGGFKITKRGIVG